MICVDPLFPTTPKPSWPYHEACHMISDRHDIEELHAFAASIGLRRAWFQDDRGGQRLPHYDLTPRRRMVAIRKGARQIDRNELVAISRAYKLDKTPLPPPRNDCHQSEFDLT